MAFEVVWLCHPEAFSPRRAKSAGSGFGSKTMGCLALMMPRASDRAYARECSRRIRGRRVRYALAYLRRRG